WPARGDVVRPPGRDGGSAPNEPDCRAAERTQRGLGEAGPTRRPPPPHIGRPPRTNRIPVSSPRAPKPSPALTPRPPRTNPTRPYRRGPRGAPARNEANRPAAPVLSAAVTRRRQK